ncbi:MAG TPA: tRNA cyclic N6-threonylcarbamoyladenosine(37) synthase TcdA [Thiotrichales bacterium]|nr:tRNA cyclic N6-threonylcarbamoyladenosine(37) synthase TcdA [Thiotrichales bacterium]
MNGAGHPRELPFDGIRRLYGDRGFEVISSLHVCVVGLGGVGSWVVEALARTGIGALTLIDYDTVERSNINRQLVALESTLGRKKGEILAERVADIHSGCEVSIVDDFVTRDNVRRLLDPGFGFDYVVDAIDSIGFKAAIIYQCRRNKIPVITTGGAGGLTDPAQVQVKDLSRTFNDALAARVRARLRDEYGFSRNSRRYFGVECVFSAQQQLYPKEDGTVCHRKPGIRGVNLDCRFGYGAASFVTATFGMLAASRVVEKSLRRHLQADRGT